VQPIPALKPSGSSSISQNGSSASRSSSRKPSPSVPKSSSCAGLRTAGTHFEKLCASSGISVPRTQYARSRNIGLTSRVSRFLNWSSCPTSVEERLAPRSRVCACLDPDCQRRHNATWQQRPSSAQLDPPLYESFFGHAFALKPASLGVSRRASNRRSGASHP
jgi:hypothetical protein